MADNEFCSSFDDYPRTDHKRKFDNSNDYERKSGSARNDHERKTGFSGPPSECETNTGVPNGYERKTGFSGPLNKHERLTGFSGPPSGNEKRTASSSDPEEPVKKTGFSGPAAEVRGSYNSVPPPLSEFEIAKQRAQQIAARLVAQDSKRPRAEDIGDVHSINAHPGGSSHDQQSYGREDDDRGQIFQNSGHGQQQLEVHGGNSFSMQGPPQSQKMDIPNAKVGLIIGKGGETIKYLQHQSGARIQVTRDGDRDPYALTRQVEIMGTPQQIGRAEQLINDLIVQSDAAGTGPPIARGFEGSAASGEQIQITIPNNKVGLIIGRGGETIKSMQNQTGARIQLVPLQHFGEAEPFERVLTLTGSKNQTDMANELIKKVINESFLRGPPMSGNYNQHGYRPSGPPQWASPPAYSMQSQGYGYPQQGSYSGPPQQYSAQSQSYRGYAQQTSSGYTSGWEPSVPGQHPEESASSDYHNQPATGPNDGYSQSQGGFGQQGLYGQQDFGQHGSGEENFVQSVPNQQLYGQAYSQQPAHGQTGFMQQSYRQPEPSPPGYMQHGYVHQGVFQPSYGQPAPSPHVSEHGYTQPGSSQEAFGEQVTPQPGYSQIQAEGISQQGFAQPGYDAQGPSEHSLEQPFSPANGQQESGPSNYGAQGGTHTQQGCAQPSFGHESQQTYGQAGSVSHSFGQQGSENIYAQQGGAQSSYGAYDDGCEFAQPLQDSRAPVQHGYAEQALHSSNKATKNGGIGASNDISPGPPESGGYQVTES